MKIIRFLALLWFASVAAAQGSWNKTSIDPSIMYSQGNWQGSGTNAILIPSALTGIGLNLARAGSTNSLNVADFFFHRSANYVGGSTGHVNASVYVKTLASSGALGYEWNGLFIMDNSGTLADASQNLALAAVAYKRSSGNTWARYAELDEDLADSTGTAVVDEVDLYANGTQVNNNRYIMHLQAGPGPNYAGVTHIENGIKFNPTVDGGGPSSNATVDNAWIAFAGDYKYGLSFTGGSSVAGSSTIIDTRTGSNLTYGLNMGGAYTSGFLFARDNKNLIWSSDQHMTTKYSSADDCLEDQAQSVALWSVCQDGHLQIGTNVILTSPAAATLQLGNASAAVPVAQTLASQSSRGGTDTNTAGANLTIQSGLGTGSATGSTIIFATPTAGSTGTTAQTATTALTIADGTILMPVGEKFGWTGRAQFISPGTASIQMGGANSASPVSQTFQTQGAIGGTTVDGVGGSLTLQSGLGTGAGTASTLTLKTPNPTSTGSTAQTAVNGLLLGSSAIQIGNATSNPTFTFLGSGAISMAGGGTITPSTTAGIVGTTAADSANAGSVGQVASIHCIVGAAAAAATTITVTIATPAVVTWSSHTFVPSSGLANYTCPINFTTTGALPTGLTVGTNYYIIGSSVSGDTFQIADTAAHALAGTNAVATSGSQSGTQAAYIGNLGGSLTVYAGAGMSLVAGDWDCNALGEFQELTSLTTTRFAAGISNTAILGAIGTFADSRTASGSIGANSVYLSAPLVQQNISATTSVYAVVTSTFSVGTQNEGGSLRCRRMR